MSFAPAAGIQNAASEIGKSDKLRQSEQEAQRNASELSTIKEGLAYILIPKDTPNSLDPKAPRRSAPSQSVFYNPIQQFNRDLTVLAIRAFGEDLFAERKIRADSRLQKPPRGKKRKRGTGNLDTETGSASANALSKAIDAGETPDIPNTNCDSSGEDILQTEVSGATHDAPTKHQKLDGPTAHDTPSTMEAQDPKLNWRTKFKILDALSATGLRALRYAQEIPFVTSVVANDLLPQATASIAANVRYNKLEGKIDVTTENAMSHMYNVASHTNSNRSPKYEVIDLDPYGTAAPFLDATMQAIADGGLLCVTCTDAGVWASVGYPEKTYALYGGTPIKGLHSHEGGLRLILHSIASCAARYGMSIEPLMSLSIDFYARIFVRVFKSPAEVKLLAGKTMLVYNCDSGCGAWTTQLLAQNKTFQAKDGSTAYKHSLAQGPGAAPFCAHCGTKTHMSGPMYAGPLHNPDFLASILNFLPELDKTIYATTDRIEGMVLTALEEMLLDDYMTPEVAAVEGSSPARRPVPRLDPSKVDAHPFFFIPSALSKVIHCRAPSEAEVKGALKHAGYSVTRSHARPGSIRTNAPWSFIWKLMLEWARQKAPIHEGAIKPGTAGWRIMEKHTEKQNGMLSSADGIVNSGADHLREGVKNVAETEAPIVFDEKLGKEANKKRLLRYQINPRANWGPMNRAKGKSRERAHPEET